MQNDKYIYLFIGLCLLSAIVQIIAVLIMSKKEIENKKVHKFYCELYESICDKDYIESLCREINKLNNITPEESLFLLNHFKSQKPSFFKHRRFYFNKVYRGKTFWWNVSCAEQSTEQRKLFVKMLIDKTKPAKVYGYEVF
jgi:hypothetical protein